MSIKRHKETLNPRNIDYFFPLQQKRELITEISKKHFKGKFLDLGCGEMPYKKIILENSSVNEYLGVDIEYDRYQETTKPDLFWDGNNLPLESKSITGSMMIEVLEHVPHPDKVLNELYRVLEPGGVCLITVPFLWNLHDVPNDEFRYTPFALKRIISGAGFNVVEMKSFGGWHASMATMLALYIRRGIKSKRRIRLLLSFLVVPIIKYLFKKDQKISYDKFSEGSMITGFWCLIRK